MSIHIQNITKTFGAYTALKGVEIEVKTGELMALLGPSGCGKTTLLRIIAGLEYADSGEVLFNGSPTAASSPRERGVGFVFQHYALFKHMNVFENVAFGLNVRPRRERPGKDAIRDKVMTLLELVQLTGMERRYPSQLSGGQRQRVALARALAVEPKLLLLDEPFGALDARVRQELRDWLRRLHDELHMTSVFVTHDQEEALEVADRVVVMNAGKVEQIGTPDEVYERPASPFVYQFLGRVNFFHGRVHQGQAALGPVAVSAPEHALAEDALAVGYARPHELEIFPEGHGDETFAAIVRRVRPIGPIVQLELSQAQSGAAITAEVTREHYKSLGIKVGSPVSVRAHNLRVFLQDDYSI